MCVHNFTDEKNNDLCKVSLNSPEVLDQSVLFFNMETRFSITSFLFLSTLCLEVLCEAFGLLWRGEHVDYSASRTHFTFPVIVLSHYTPSSQT